MPFHKNSDVSLFYTDSEGTGPPVLFLHGWACDSHDWSYQIPFLISLGYRVIAMDHRGHGRSTSPSPPSSPSSELNSSPPPPSSSGYSLSALASDAASLLTHLSTGPVILIAHSMGTVIASLLTISHPTLIRALILAHPIYSGVPPALPLMAARMRSLSSSSPAQIPVLAADFFSKLMYTPQTPSWLKTWQIRRVLGCEPEMLVGCVDGIVDIFDSVMGQTEACKAFMQKRTVPRLVVCTEAIPGAEAWERELGVREGVDEVWVLGGGTFAHMVEHERFNGILGEWLKKGGLPGGE
ncbi:alpha/beta-hydrolase [Lindgomyces ingoldianus]|uniref:Alpha/beta-hydrolase n=1 Tax=Lindgomyces ingoldianus TaxID=673940 RepID=A0ACB6QZK4_9PLEO|nr:alpha/beta-hydrolase [Lindgomyces ingoldianus]KAF2472217.1 alpha/beta-hydrolase [Lindgomyces ingoldianus]